ncbi:MAG: SAM-dependent DNA methyltransferase [Proteobacteria bacterium]|nr:SAM-dependent DNA methyltransferase [Pseudomonadota bacterium]
MSERYLPSTLRRTLERVIKDARIVAEEGARDATRRLGVTEGKAPSYLSEEEKELRRRLRAHSRALGDAFDRTNDTQETKHLIEATAYAHWHRMLFARFLAERGLLRNPEYDVPVTLEDCRELAEAEGLTDPWTIAERYAAQMLPAVFRVDDPVLALEIDPVHTQKLQKLVTGLDAEVFEAEDSLGWTYQFWRAAEKDAVNASGVKIGADELPAVTQLFTEPYMVRFLLHNTLGAWWAGKVLASNPTLAETAADEDELRAACSLPDYSFDMLRFVRDGDDGPWRPAAGTFPGWPREAKEVTVLDPCCGSGHFLTESLEILAALRRTEEGLFPADAVTAVLRDNLHGLEIDGRCVQIAAFAVALTAWRMGGWQVLPLPHIAWVGAPPPLPRKEFSALADGDEELKYALEALHDFFVRAPILGTLLEPTGGDLFEAEKLQKVEAILEPLLEKARRAEPERAEGMISARGMADAAELLHKKYVLQATNVPFLGRNKQAAELVKFVDERYPHSSADLAPTMVLRLLRLAVPGGSISFVTPQNWLFLKTYRKMRQSLIAGSVFDLLSPLGSRAFETISGEIVNVALMAISRRTPSESEFFSGIDATGEENSSEKSRALVNGRVVSIKQNTQLANAESRILLQETKKGVSLAQIADVYEGLSRGDSERFDRNFWEISLPDERWKGLCETAGEEGLFSGRTTYFLWENGEGSLSRNPSARIQGLGAWGRDCVIVERTGAFKARLSVGDVHAQNCVALVPKSNELLPTILSFVQSEDFRSQLKKLADKLILPTGIFLQTKLELDVWTKAASKSFSSGLTEPMSYNPNNWLFSGHPENCEDWAAIHVALARLCGYRWPAENDPSLRLSDVARSWVEKSKTLPEGDNDGLLGVPAVAGEKPLADRLRAFLALAFGKDWSDGLEQRLVAAADKKLDRKSARDGSLEAWLRERAFRQHCIMFDQRPFLWHISDGLKDGFSVFVHYHRFDQANLRKLTYTLLGDWLARAKAEGNTLRFEKGRELQQKLEAILGGEKPYDIFVRWKSLAQQPLGWDPDLDDGVRQNIRPFILAGVLTHKLDKTLKDKDRGKDVRSAPWYDVFKGERRNDHHTTLAEKRAAREEAARRVEASR